MVPPKPPMFSLPIFWRRHAPTAPFETLWFETGRSAHPAAVSLQSRSNLHSSCLHRPTRVPNFSTAWRPGPRTYWTILCTIVGCRTSCTSFLCEWAQSGPAKNQGCLPCSECRNQSGFHPHSTQKTPIAVGIRPHSIRG